MADAGPCDSRCADAKERCRQISCDLSNVNATLRRARKRAATKDHVPAAMWETACVIALLGHPDVKAAGSFLVAKKPRLHRRLRSLEAELDVVSRETSEAARVRKTTAPTTKQERAALERAQNFLAEAGLNDWVAEQNVAKGIAPMSGVVMDHMRRTNLRPSVKRKNDLQWLRRWRRRWNLTLGTFVNRELVGAAEAQRKATFCRGMLLGP